jgi:penicillin-binding protein 1A
VGFDDHYTVAVWVGYPDKLIPMKTLWGGKPVEGGTYPATIWHDFMVSALNILHQRNPKKNKLDFTNTGSTLPSPSYGTSTPSSSGGTGGGGTGTNQKSSGQQDSTKNKTDNAGGGGGGGNQGNNTPSSGQTPSQQNTPAPTQNGTGGAGTGGAGAPTG